MHTKGPWEAHNGEVTTQQVGGRSYRRIAAVQDYGMGCLPEVDEANAKLIAAAPDMLYALERTLISLEHHAPSYWGSDIARIRAAIAKVK